MPTLTPPATGLHICDWQKRQRRRCRRKTRRETIPVSDQKGVFLQEGTGNQSPIPSQPEALCQWQGCHYPRYTSMSRKKNILKLELLNLKWEKTTSCYFKVWNWILTSVSCLSAGPTLQCLYHLSRCTVLCLQGATGHNWLLRCGLHPGRNHSNKSGQQFIPLNTSGHVVQIGKLWFWREKMCASARHSPGYSAELPWLCCKWGPCPPLCPSPAGRPSPPPTLPPISSSSSEALPKSQQRWKIELTQI